MEVDWDCVGNEVGGGAVGGFGGQGNSVSAGTTMGGGHQMAYSSQPMVSFCQALDTGNKWSNYSPGGVYQAQQVNHQWGWGSPSAAAVAGQGGFNKKRNAAEAELVEFKEVGNHPEDVEMGHNARKIRTLDFPDEAVLTKNGYVVDEAFKAFEKRLNDVDDWVSVGPNQTYAMMLKEANQAEDKRFKVAKRRSNKVSSTSNEENWEEEMYSQQ